MIQVERLTKYYGDVLAVDDLSFHVEKGEVVAFLGPNGAGKSTTMRMLTCYLAATKGTARIAGFSVVDDPVEVRRHIGYLPETVPLYREMRVTEFLNFRAKLKGVARSDRRKQIAECLELCDLSHMADRIIDTLSKGYRQRVGLAESLINDPEILILDEPTVGLDPNQIRLTRQVVKDLAEKHTVLLSTHILPEVEMVCERSMIIDQGRVVAMDTMDSLAHRSSTIVEVNGPPEQIERRLADIAGVEKVTCKKGENYHRFSLETTGANDVREDVAAALVGAGWTMRELHRQASSLEEVFVEATMKEAEDEDTSKQTLSTDVATTGEGEEQG